MVRFVMMAKVELERHVVDAEVAFEPSGTKPRDWLTDVGLGETGGVKLALGGFAAVSRGGCKRAAPGTLIE